MNELERLAAGVGILLEYRDATGTLRRPSPDVLKALLAALGVPAGSPADVRSSLRSLDQRKWSRALEPRVALETAAPVTVAVTLPAATRGLHWTVLLEDGTTRDGDAQFADLELELARDGLERRRLPLAVLPRGHHRLRLEPGDAGVFEEPLVVVPERCHTPPERERVWGLATQLYALRSQRNFGHGDLGDLRALAPIAAKLGAAVIGVNPLHALFPDEPERASPYSPSSRLFLNVLYIDVARVPAIAGIDDAGRWLGDAALDAALHEVRNAERVDYARVAALKLPLLERLFAAFRAGAPDDRRRRFDEFRREQGVPLERFCRFAALRERFRRERPELADWRRWPAEYREPDSAAVAAFAERERDRIAFHAWLQWLAHEQLDAAARAARQSGLAVGLYRDLAVGADPAGAEAWSYPERLVRGVTIGAPPDMLNPAGQNWALPPPSPEGLREDGYAGFVDLLRANMRAAGAIRIDHAMALERLYWIPDGAPPTDGAYVRYPLDDLLGVLALESRRAGCIVIGEDLGTVPEGFRERMQRAGVLSYRVLLFERDERRLRAPREYPHLALATIGSHDLATLRGWWEGRDLAAKERAGLYANDAIAAEQRATRALERRLLLEALEREPIALPDGFGPDSPFELALAVAVHELLARTESWLAIAQLEDLITAADQANLPGSTVEYPNWRLKLAVPLEALAADERVLAIAAALRRHRS